MRPILRSLLITATALYFTTLVLPGITFSRGFKGLTLTVVILVLVDRLIKPLINLLFLPLNLITLGMFRWVINVFVLYLVSLLSPDLMITGFTLNQFYFTPLLSLVAASFVLSLSHSALRWFLH